METPFSSPKCVDFRCSCRILQTIRWRKLDNHLNIYHVNVYKLDNASLASAHLISGHCSSSHPLTTILLERKQVTFPSANDVGDGFDRDSADSDANISSDSMSDDEDDEDDSDSNSDSSASND
jgi:hypothetical protein